MNVSRKVLHLSLTLAMSLPGYAAIASSDETTPASGNEAAPNATQLAAGKGGAQLFKNAGDADLLRHRVNEPAKDQAERSRQERQAPADQLNPQDTREIPDLIKQQDRLRDHDPLRDQDALHDQDRLRERDHLREQDPLHEQDRLRDRDRLSERAQTESPQAAGDQLKARQQSRNQFLDRYQFEQRSAGQGFDTGGSMYQRMGSGGSAIGGGGPSTRAGSSSGGHAQGGGRAGGGGRR
ncbi:MAG: hypothetical protein P8166_10705 [Candidatus Thiodiazotropha sp.]|jgi:hypothetical protein